ncbi:MAG: N-acetylneuraminate synthase [Vulcanococcus sp.]|jgi:N-acetylneuraminate synthase|uniref:N-acetylneuraminate synthase n=1 Tax=Vulcanococcus sp. TaxID=2856995 RepID=UPI0025CFC8BF|nr:N-acetylneuraminate synthase [Vulcanococcus sp.]MBW0180978.1 N-acetylneuraminate synthase [Vulcanococcus sp.]
MNRTLLIAEAGVNHNGDLNLAFGLVEAAAQAGADVVKFQTFRAKELATDQADKAAYQKDKTGEAESQLTMLKKLELTPEQHLELIDYCQACSIEFLSTAFDPASIDLLASLNLRRWKIPSGEITNLPYLRKIGSLSQPVILSTGMANLGEIEAAIDVLEQAGTRRDLITVLHCTTEYPAPLDEVNLRAMQTIAQAFGVAVGYSDHTDGIAVPIAAVAMGATVIEKHITLDSNMEGPDHKASLEPDHFAAMVHGVRVVERAMGDGIKRPTPCERANLAIVRKSLVASRAIQAGQSFTTENITSKRPGTGISPMHWDALIGRNASRAYHPDELIEW